MPVPEEAPVSLEQASRQLHAAILLWLNAGTIPAASEFVQRVAPIDFAYRTFRSRPLIEQAARVEVKVPSAKMLKSKITAGGRKCMG
jgi:hypothetical protein